MTESLKNTENDNQKCNDPVIEQVVAKLRQRSLVGEKKYGTTLETNQNRDPNYWLTHIQEELMDAVNYIEKLKTIIQVYSK